MANFRNNSLAYTYCSSFALALLLALAMYAEMLLYLTIPGTAPEYLPAFLISRFYEKTLHLYLRLYDE